MCNGGDGVVRVVCVQRFRDFIYGVVVFCIATNGGQEAVGVVFKFRKNLIYGVSMLADGNGVAEVVVFRGNGTVGAAIECERESGLMANRVVITANAHHPSSLMFSAGEKAVPSPVSSVRKS